MTSPDIYNFIKGEENNYETQEIQVGDNWSWNMRDHIQMIFHLKNGMFYSGDNNYSRAFKNIMESTLNLAYWTEDLEVKDVTFFIENDQGRVLSFFVKKYHDEVYSHQHDLDKMFDEITESDLDYGGALVQRSSGKRPEVLKLKNVAFCDQTDLLGGPIGFKFHFSPDKLRSMAKSGWGEESNGATISLEELAMLASNTKDGGGRNDAHENKVPGKTVEVYIVRGNLPEAYLMDNDNMEDHYNQIHVVAFYTDEKKKKQGVTLYRKKEDEGNLKFFTSEEVEDRALGRGVGERLLHPQVWTNFLTIHKMRMLEAGAKTPLYTDDESFTQKNKVQDMENLEVMTIAEGRSVGLIPTVSPANVQLYDKSVNEWYEQAQLEGSAFDPLMGKEGPSGTTFRGQERVVQQGKGAHDRRRGQRAKFIEEIYRDWIIPDIKREILKGAKFMATLSSDELTWVADQLVTNRVNRRIAKAMIDGKMVTEEEKQAFEQIERDTMVKKGNKYLLEILKDEFKDIELKMGINVAGKQKDLVGLNDKVLSIFQFAFTNPEAFQQSMQIPYLANAFQDILEYSGLNQSDFLSLSSPAKQAPQQAQAPQQQQTPSLLPSQPAV
jgi:hypothetical protein